MKRAILGYSGPKKWRVSTAFIKSLDKQQRQEFLDDYQKRSGGKPDIKALLESAKAVKATYSIAGELLTPTKGDRLGSTKKKKTKR